MHSHTHRETFSVAFPTPTALLVAWPGQPIRRWPLLELAVGALRHSCSDGESVTKAHKYVHFSDQGGILVLSN
jgi:hypothetical protein